MRARITALIVDDEPLARAKLRDLISGLPWIDCVGEAGDGRAAVRAIDEQRPDLVFLDVRMPGHSGLEVLERVSHRPAVIFTTAYDQHAVAAFELAAIDYLLKPFGRDRFMKALERARPRLTRAGGVRESLDERLRDALTEPSSLMRRIFARDRGRTVPLRTAEIVRLEACDDFVAVHARGREFTLNVPLGVIADRLDPATFVRVHRSHVVNLDHVLEITPYDVARLALRLRDGSEVVASRQGSRLLRTTGR